MEDLTFEQSLRRSPNKEQRADFSGGEKSLCRRNKSRAPGLGQVAG